MTNPVPLYFVKNRRDTSANWWGVNPVLRPGEIGLEQDTGLFKFGDGVHNWNQLPYANAATGGGGGAVDSVNSKTGVVVLTASDVGADASGAAATAQSNAESFATSAVATETSRAEAAEADLLPLAGGTLSGALTIDSDAGSGTPPLVANNTATGEYIEAFNAYGPNATDGNYVLFHVGAGDGGNTAEFAYIQGSPRQFTLGFQGGPSPMGFDDTQKVWTGTGLTVRNVLDDGSGNMTVEGFAIGSGSPTANYSDQLPAAFHGLTNASGSGSILTPVYAAIANRNAARVDIPIIGDSVTEGQGATTIENRWIGQANRAIRTAYPTTGNGASGGLGFIAIETTGETSYTWPITLASGSIGDQLDLGPVRQSGGFDTTTAVWTFTAPEGTTSVKISYYDGTTPGGFTYQVGSGSVVTVNNTEALADAVTSNITITSGEVLTISATANGNCFVTGIIHYAGDETSGITFHGCGRFGWCAGTESNGWSQPELEALNWEQAYSNVFDSPVALGIMLGINDADASDGNRTAAEFQSDLAGLISQLRSNGNNLSTAPFILITEYKPDITLTDSGGWPAYMEAIRAVAAADGNAVVIDLNYRMPDNNSSAPYWADGYHPSDTGAALIGEAIASALRIA